MPVEDPYRQARTEALKSFGHKVAILSIAFFGYIGLTLIGTAKEAHEKQKQERYQLTKEHVGEFARIAREIAPASGNADVLAAVANDFNSTAAPKHAIATRDALAAAVGELADAHVWRDTAAAIATSKAELLSAAKATASTTSTTATTEKTATIEKRAASEKTKETEKIAKTIDGVTSPDGYVNVIAAEEAYARTRIAGVHALINAAATQLESPKETAPILDAMFDEKSPLYVLYEICWFALLALAVLASAWLLMLFFTVLPFTSSEGYWTKRIGAILERFSGGAAGATAVLPLASAALIAATVFTGTASATVPGGYSRSSVTTVQTTQPTIERVVTNTNPAELTAEQLAAALKTLSERFDRKIEASERIVRDDVNHRAAELDLHLKAADQKQAKIFDAAWDASVSARMAASNTITVPTIDRRTETMAETLGEPQNVTVAKAVVTTATAVTNGAGRLEKANASLEERAETDAAVRSATFARAAIVDDRSFFWRTFGRTTYHSSDAAVRAMAATLGVELKADGQPKQVVTADEKLIQALYTIRGVAAVNSSKFRETLSNAMPDAPAKTLIDSYWPELLHVCEVPRD
jgi:hypothetical protein